MIESCTAIDSTSNTQPIANKDGKFLLKNESRFRFQAEWMMGISGSISCIVKPPSVKNFLAVARL